MKRFLALVVGFCLLVAPCSFFCAATEDCDENPDEASYIKWVDFGVSAKALADTAAADIALHESDRPLSWIEMLAYLAARYGGKFASYQKADLTAYLEKRKTETPETLVKNRKLYDYYYEAYEAILSGLLGPYWLETLDEAGHAHLERQYGVKAFHPIARGYSFSEYDDFGNARNYGYRRNHLGHDMMGSVGTPIIAVESGVVEALGWNRFGGWRVGIRSFDGKRYYYYAHMRKGHPYADMYEGKVVSAGEVIGYLGMTGYSSKKDVNNINVPHLHIGLQLIFNPKQKEGVNQVWVDFLPLSSFLSKYRNKAYQKPDGSDFTAKTRVIDLNMPD
ncbi:MAG: M23 family metallopeptidase [Eubacteriales bacterium]